MGRRGRYEFPQGVIESARMSWHKDNPNRQDELLEVDHIIAVAVAKRLLIPADLIRTRSNAKALTIGEHLERHRNDLSDKEYKVMAQSILGWSSNLI